MESLETFDISSRSHKADAHSTYTRLRETTPGCKVMLPTKEPAWLLSRYTDVSALLKDPRFAKDAANAKTADQLKRMRTPPKLLMPLRRNMLAMDDPDHARLKKLVQAGFTPKRVELLANRTEEIAERLLNRLEGRRSFDLISERPASTGNCYLGIVGYTRTRSNQVCKVVAHAVEGSHGFLASCIRVARHAPVRPLSRETRRVEEVQSR
jgi:cytochrome P450